jgi:uncharacterized phage protein (TIGR01671 family)
VREIEFRGKATNGKWYYGCYTKYSRHESGITVNNGEVYTKTVDTLTVGQYIGLTDKNDKRIYEDDIVVRERSNGLSPIIGRISYVDTVPGFYVCYAENKKGELHLASIFGNLEYTNKFYDNGKALNLEVIGNVHDDPSFKEKLESAKRLTE